MNIINWTSSQFQKYRRVWRLMKQPSISEVKTISKVTSIGILVIGALGFVISLIVTAIL